MNRLLCVLLLSVSIGIYAAESTASSSTKRKSPDTPELAPSPKKSHTSPMELPVPNLFLNSPVSPTPPTININPFLPLLLPQTVQIPSPLSLLNPLIVILMEQIQQAQKKLEALNTEQGVMRIESETKEHKATMHMNQLRIDQTKITSEIREELEETTKGVNLQSALIIDLIQRVTKLETEKISLSEQVKKLMSTLEKRAEQEKTKDPMDWFT